MIVLLTKHWRIFLALVLNKILIKYITCLKILLYNSILQRTRQPHYQYIYLLVKYVVRHDKARS
jgi:hypothetical protein